MKLFSSIMALYMMVLFMMPCADMFEKEMFTYYNHSSEITQEHNHNHSEIMDLCTPFCVCGCCGAVSGVVIQWHLFSFDKIKSFDFSTTDIHYKSVFIPRYIGEIWQPPKINA